MKIKNFESKLNLKKTTIADLNGHQMKDILGGVSLFKCGSDTCQCNPTDSVFICTESCASCTGHF